MLPIFSPIHGKMSKPVVEISSLPLFILYRTLADSVNTQSNPGMNFTMWRLGISYGKIRGLYPDLQDLIIISSIHLCIHYNHKCKPDATVCWYKFGLREFDFRALTAVWEGGGGGGELIASLCVIECASLCKRRVELDLAWKLDCLV